MAGPNRNRRPEVFLLGAGFSRAISPAMPLLQGLAARVLRRSDRRVPSEVAAMMEENFAHALSYLEQAKPWITEADNLRHRALFLDFCSAIARDLDVTTARVARRMGAQPPDWLTRLIHYWHENRCTVLTLNYDTLIETIAATVPVGDSRPLVAAQMYPPVLTDAGSRARGAAHDEQRPSFRLLKLHGSTNWYYSGRGSARGEPIYFVPPLPCGRASADQRREFEFRMKTVADKYPFLVPPVYDKSTLLTHETIRALWFEAGDALKHAQRIVCMGYSLPASDLTMRHFLQTTAGATATFEIVDPASDARRNFLRLFKGTKIRVTQRARGPESIRAFVTRLGAPPD